MLMTDICCQNLRMNGRHNARNHLYRIWESEAGICGIIDEIILLNGKDICYNGVSYLNYQYYLRWLRDNYYTTYLDLNRRNREKFETYLETTIPYYVVKYDSGKPVVIRKLKHGNYFKLLNESKYVTGDYLLFRPNDIKHIYEFSTIDVSEEDFIKEPFKWGIMLHYKTPFWKLSYLGGVGHDLEKTVKSIAF